MVAFKKFFVISIILLLFSCIFTTSSYAVLGKTIEESFSGIQFPAEVSKDAKLTQAFYFSESIGFFRFDLEKNHYDILVDWKTRKIAVIRSYINGEWKFWRYNEHGVPLPISEKKFFEFLGLFSHKHH